MSLRPTLGGRGRSSSLAASPEGVNYSLLQGSFCSCLSQNEISFNGERKNTAEENDMCSYYSFFYIDRDPLISSSPAYKKVGRESNSCRESETRHNRCLATPMARPQAFKLLSQDHLDNTGILSDWSCSTGNTTPTRRENLHTNNALVPSSSDLHVDLGGGSMDITSHGRSLSDGDDVTNPMMLSYSLLGCLSDPPGSVHQSVNQCTHPAPFRSESTNRKKFVKGDDTGLVGDQSTSNIAEHVSLPVWKQKRLSDTSFSRRPSVVICRSNLPLENLEETLRRKGDSPSLASDMGSDFSSPRTYVPSSFFSVLPPEGCGAVSPGGPLWASEAAANDPPEAPYSMLFAELGRVEFSTREGHAPSLSESNTIVVQDASDSTQADGRDSSLVLSASDPLTSIRSFGRLARARELTPRGWSSALRSGKHQAAFTPSDEKTQAPTLVHRRASVPTWLSESFKMVRSPNSKLVLSPEDTHPGMRRASTVTQFDSGDSASSPEGSPSLCKDDRISAPTSPSLSMPMDFNKNAVSFALVPTKSIVQRKSVVGWSSVASRRCRSLPNGQPRGNWKPRRQPPGPREGGHCCDDRSNTLSPWTNVTPPDGELNGVMRRTMMCRSAEEVHKLDSKGVVRCKDDRGTMSNHLKDDFLQESLMASLKCTAGDQKPAHTTLNGDRTHLTTVGRRWDGPTPPSTTFHVTFAL